MTHGYIRPAADNRWCKTVMNPSFLLTNMCLQDEPKWCCMAEIRKLMLYLGKGLILNVPKSTAEIYMKLPAWNNFDIIEF